MINGLATVDDLKYEPMLFGAGWNFANENCGSITKSILNSISNLELFQIPWDLNQQIVIDTRVTMTMPGQYPSIPGWHCDDVPRPNGQPDMRLIKSEVKHLMCILSDKEDVSCTEFVTENVDVDLDENRVWASLDEEINKLKPMTGFIKPGQIVLFDQNTIHRASPTKQGGWRLFFRLSYTHRKPINEIRKQVQVYTPINGGW